MQKRQRDTGPINTGGVLERSNIIIFIAMILCTIGILLYLNHSGITFRDLAKLFFIPDFSQIGNAPWQGGIENF